MEIIEINSHNELPKGIEMNYYTPPYMGEPVEEISNQFQRKYNKLPETIYRLEDKYWVVK